MKTIFTAAAFLEVRFFATSASRRCFKASRIIHIDDVGYGDLQCYNPQCGKMPMAQSKNRHAVDESR
jgi:hypothetical protein